MSTADHTALVQRHVGLLNAGDVPGYMELYAPDCVFHGYPAQFTPDHAGARQFYTALTQGFPDAQVAPADLVVAGDRVVVRFILTGTHTGEFLGTPATGSADIPSVLRSKENAAVVIDAAVSVRRSSSRG